MATLCSRLHVHVLPKLPESAMSRRARVEWRNERAEQRREHVPRMKYYSRSKDVWLFQGSLAGDVTGPTAARVIRTEARC